MYTLGETVRSRRRWADTDHIDLAVPAHIKRAGGMEAFVLVDESSESAHAASSRLLIKRREPDWLS